MALTPCPECKNAISTSARMCPNCGYEFLKTKLEIGKIESFSNSKETVQSANLAREQVNKKRIGLLLGIGILFMPYFFSWVTLKKGYSTIARLVSFGWALSIVAVVAHNPKDHSATNDSTAHSKQPSQIYNRTLSLPEGLQWGMSKNSVQAALATRLKYVNEIEGISENGLRYSGIIHGLKSQMIDMEFQNGLVSLSFSLDRADLEASGVIEKAKSIVKKYGAPNDPSKDLILTKYKQGLQNAGFDSISFWKFDNDTTVLLAINQKQDFVIWQAMKASAIAEMFKDIGIPRLNAMQLVQDYDGNEIAADKSYKGKILMIDGTVQDVKKDILGKMYVILGRNDFSLRGVQAFFDSRWQNQLSSLQKGQSLSVKCRVEGLLINVLVEDCEILRPVATRDP